MTMVRHGFTLFLVFLTTLTTFLSHDPCVAYSLSLSCSLLLILAAMLKALRENGEEEEKEAENLVVINWGKNSKKRGRAPLMPREDGNGTKSGKRKFISTSCYF